MNILTIPAYLTPISRWTEPVQVVSAPTVKKNSEGEVKTNENFSGLTPYRVGVEVITGTKTKVMPDGSKLEFPQVETKNITVWSAGVVHATVGDYVRLVQPLLGAFDGSIYVQALGLEPVDELEQLIGGVSDE